MSRPTYNVKETYIGNGALASYSFDFKIEVNTQLLIIVLDDTGVEVERVRGDDNTYLDSVIYNPNQGGGTVLLAANLPTDYKIVILLANDAPTQPYEFSNKLSFSLKTIERALDFITGPIQRLAFLMNTSIKLNFSDDETTFNTELPAGASLNADKVLQVNEDGDAFIYGPTIEEISGTVKDDFIVSVNQGRYTTGNLITAGTPLRDVVQDMLQKDTPPEFTLSGSGTKIVESGTTITPVLTPAFTANDAGPANAYELFKDAVSIWTNATPTAHSDTVFKIVDESVTYNATLDYDASVLLPADTLTSNDITYYGVRAAFYEAGGDIVNIRSNSGKTLNPANGTNLAISGDSSSTVLVWSYPATLRDPIKVEHNDGSGGIYDLTGSVVSETTQMVDDADSGNPISYKVFTYTSALPFNAVDTITLTI